MEQVTLPGIERPVSRVGLGTCAIGGWMRGGGIDEDDAVRTIRAAVEGGIDLVDTAPAYGFGRAEEIVGRALAEGGLRERVVLATKVGLAWTKSGSVRRDSTPERIEEEIEASLRRLRTDRIDLYQVHWPDPFEPFEDTARALERLRQAGKILAVGVANFAPSEMERFRAVAPLYTAQAPLDLFERAAEDDVLPWCRTRGVGTIAYGTLCRGLLSGRMRPDTRFSEGDLRGDDPKLSSPRFAQYLGAVAALDDFARERWGRRVVDLALRWVLDRPGVDVALLGARRPEQVDAAFGAMGFSIDAETMRRIDAIVAEHVRDPIGPALAAPPTRPIA